MSTWLETTRRTQNGEPVLRRIRTPSFTDDIWFTDRGYAEVENDNLADHLETLSDNIQKVAQPDNPGDYYGNVSANAAELQLVLEDGFFDVVTAQEGHIDNLSTDTFEPDEFSPTEVGTSNNPVPSGYIESFGTEEVDNHGPTYAVELNHTGDPEWIRIGTLHNRNQISLHCIVTETSRTGGDGEPGYEILHYRVGNNSDVLSGTHVEFADVDNRVRESSAKIVYDEASDEHYFYYKPGPYQTADIHAYPNSSRKSNFDFEFVDVGLDEPVGDIEYSLDRHFNIAAEQVKTDADVIVKGSLDTEEVDSGRVSVTNTDNGPYTAGEIVGIRGTDIGRAMALQAQDDGDTNSHYAKLRWYGANEEFIAGMVAHYPDNHFSLYTRDSEMGDGDNSIRKRLDIEADSVSTRVRWPNLSDMRLMRLQDDGGDVNLSLQRKAEGDAVLNFDDENASTGYSLTYNQFGALILRDNENVGGPILRIGGGRIDFRGIPVDGVDTDGATPSDTSTPASWEEVEGEDGETYYRPLYQ